MCKYFYLHVLFSCSINIYTKEALFFFFGFKFWLLRMQPCSVLPVKRIEKLWLVMSLISLPHNPALFICDVTGMHCWAQNGSIHGHVFLNFRHQFSTQGMDMWIRECVFYCILINKTCNASSAPLTFIFILVAATSIWSVYVIRCGHQNIFSALEFVWKGFVYVNCLCI